MSWTWLVRSNNSRLDRIENLLDEINTKVEKLMSGEDDLKAALTANAATIATAATTIQNGVAALVAAAKATASGDNDADIETLAQQLTAQTASLSTLVTTAFPAPAAASAPAASAPAAPAAPAAGS